MEKLRLIPTPQDAMLGNSTGEEIPKKGDLHLHAVTMLRNMIITGALAPGERLNERELCASLNASRTPVREAIKTLAQDGLIEVSPNRSPVVFPLDARKHPKRAASFCRVGLLDVCVPAHAQEGEPD